MTHVGMSNRFTPLLFHSWSSAPRGPSAIEPIPAPGDTGEEPRSRLEHMVDTLSLIASDWKLGVATMSSVGLLNRTGTGCPPTVTTFWVASGWKPEPDNRLHTHT